jgi:signal transduction histidine kinase
VDRAIDAINVAIRDIRSFILGLRPHLLEQDDLVEGLDALVAETRLNSMIDVDLGVTDLWEPSAVDPATRSHLVHIAREALSNIARHSSATRATVDLSVGADAVALTIADAGSGFDPELHRSGTHQGLGNIRERAAAIGARLSIDSEPGRGTRIIVTVPTNRRDPAT